MIRLDLDPSGPDANDVVPPGAVAVVTIDRQERRNALHVEACRELVAAVAEAEKSGARVLVLTGAHGAFCSGADLAEVRGDGFHQALLGALRSLLASPAVCIAAVDGPAMGAGVQLALACDLRVATPRARFAVPAARLGLMVDPWTVRRLAALAGRGAAQAVLLGAGELDGDAALGCGLVQRAGDLGEALAWARQISAMAPLSMAGHKLVLNRPLPGEPEESDIVAAYERAWSSEDLSEGIAAFRERRPARFRSC